MSGVLTSGQGKALNPRDNNGDEGNRRRLLRCWSLLFIWRHERKNFTIFGPPAAPFSDDSVAGGRKLGFATGRTTPGTTNNRQSRERNRQRGFLRRGDGKSPTARQR
jgi:hypothetical protein